MSWIADNAATIIVGAILLIAVALAIRYMIKMRGVHWLENAARTVAARRRRNTGGVPNSRENPPI